MYGGGNDLLVWLGVAPWGRSCAAVVASMAQAVGSGSRFRPDLLSVWSCPTGGA
jgi:hypothetical protein